MIRKAIIAYSGLIIAFGLVWLYVLEDSPVWIALMPVVVYTFASVLVEAVRGWSLTRLVRNGVVAASAAILLFWVISAVAYVRVPYTPTRAVALGEGNFIHHTGVASSGTPLTFTATWSQTIDLFGSSGGFDASWGKGKVAHSRHVPIWRSALALAVSAVVLCLFARRCPPATGCQCCGYNLRGNVSGVCPECGTPI